MTKKKEFNFTLSDGKTMHLHHKGEILFLDAQGKGVKEISGITGWSMDWITNIIGVLKNCDIHDELIKIWKEKQNENSGRSTKGKQRKQKRTSSRGVSGKTKRKKSKSDNLQVRSTTPKLTRTRVRNVRKSSTVSGQPRNRGNSGGNSRQPRRIIDRLKNNADYKG